MSDIRSSRRNFISFKNLKFFLFLSAVLECAKAAHAVNGYVMSDGGCVFPGDVAKVYFILFYIFLIFFKIQYEFYGIYAVWIPFLT